MGKKGGSSPRMPDPIDPGKSMGEYLFGKGFQSNYNGITDPRLQQRLLEAEGRYRPQYSALELADINTMWEGFEDVCTSPQYQSLQAELAGLEAGAKVSDLNIEDRRAALGEQYDALKPKGDSKYGGKKGRSSRGRSGRSGRRSVPGVVFGGKKGKDGKKTGVNENREAYIKAGLKDTKGRASRIAEIKTRMGEMDKMEGVKGYKGLLADASRQSGMLEREMLGLQRKDDVSALEEYAPQVVEAYRAADPYSTGLAEQQTAMADDLYQRSQGLNAEQQRIVDQQALQMSQMSGRIGDESSAAGQILGREQYLSGLRGQAAGMGQQAFNMNRNIAGDIGSTILGRPSSAIGLGQSGVGAATNLAAGQMGPQLFDPNVGLNMAMQQRSQDVTFQGMKAQADAASSAGSSGMLGSALGAAGSVVGGMASGGTGFFACWVAREVYGIESNKWMQFREWMLNDSPSWFRKLYLKYGERFAEFISDKPRIKSIILKWMNTKIK